LTGIDRAANAVRVGRLITVPLFCAGLAACTTTKSDQAEINTKTKFSSADYGVEASPRVTTEKTVRAGGGRYQLGDAYKVAGKWYTPAENPDYDKVGMASWYGPNFHGRLTANGEIYNQYSLSAAHPTMPLPSYARVTNEQSGDSVIVRVNDRGPFAPGRIIDLSSEAAGLLHMKQDGVAKVRVQFVGLAPLDGHDKSYLMASYRRGDGEGHTIDPSTGQTGVMLAMNDTAPAPADGLPGVSTDTTSASGGSVQPAAAVPVSAPAAVALVSEPAMSPAQQGIQAALLPDVGPVPVDRPDDPVTMPTPARKPYAVASAYAENRVADASQAFGQVLDGQDLTREAILAAWNKDSLTTY